MSRTAQQSTEYSRKWREKNRAIFNRRAREAYARKYSGPENAKNRLALNERALQAHCIRKYGITIAEREEMIKRQHGKCLICDKAFRSSRGTHIDHDHITGMVRGILCHTCNTKLGWFEAHHVRIKRYLEKTPCQPAQN